MADSAHFSKKMFSLYVTDILGFGCTPAANVDSEWFFTTLELRISKSGFVAPCLLATGKALWSRFLRFAILKW